MYVLDATPLIYLGKAQQVDVLDGVPERCVIPEPIYDEVVVAGREAGHPDARRIERVVEDGTLSTVSVDETPLYERLCEHQRLSDADAAVLAVAATTDATAVMDEQYGRNAASAEEIATRGTAYLVLSAQKCGVIGDQEARETIDTMIDAGWYCAPDLYARVCRKIEELAEGSG
ncbi:MAG: putative nucleic acid-binding protein, contains PIN domain protein [halophilic archaeon J07HB67]|jgi:Predicted nucleic acid-binding protein, contains PIN domain|nr:MAG: putative nucleic acid-binding protein, contains PIN domain protein [halophilic archaeon J07HB67]